MAKKRQQYKPRAFESKGKRKKKSGKEVADTFAMVFLTMLESPAYKDLTTRQQALYIWIKAQLCGADRHPRIDYPEQTYPEYEEIRKDTSFYFSWANALETGLYTKSMQKNFSCDMQALKNHGLIDIVMNGKAHRKRTVYKYSSEWQKWNI